MHRALFEPIVETLCYSVEIKSSAGTACNVNKGKAFLLLKRKSNGLEFLDERVARLILVICMLAACGWPSCLRLTHCHTWVVFSSST